MVASSESIVKDYLSPKLKDPKAVHLGDELSLYGVPRDHDVGLNDTDIDVRAPSFLEVHLLSIFEPTENRIAMKLFGSKKALENEKNRQRAAGFMIIHPLSNFRFYWDLTMLVLLVANLIILPVAIAFFNDDLSARWVVFNIMADTIFIIDILVNFRTGVMSPETADQVILEPRAIAQQYLKTWFSLDLISSMPIDYIFFIFQQMQADNLNSQELEQIIQAGRALKILRLAKLLSLLRLLRLSRLVRYVSQWEQFLNMASLFVRIFNLISMMLLIGHWSGCLQFLVPMLQDFPLKSWVAINELQLVPWYEQYSWALFKAMSHMLCIGYGRFPPQHMTELQQVDEYMCYRKLPREMRLNIQDFFEHRYGGKYFDEGNILGELSEKLREDVINYNCRSLVASVPFFANADPNFVTAVVTKLKYEVCQPSDIIIKEGSIGSKMYFIQEGIVDIITAEGEIATSLSDGSYFGEICLLTNARRVASVQAVTYCNLFSLSVEHFNMVLDHYPLMRQTMETIAAERLHKIGKNPSIAMSRDTENRIDRPALSIYVQGADTGSSSDEEEIRNSHMVIQHRAPTINLKDVDNSDIIV
ncbi:PREDICTED: potassium/sodium hyperpolarization-activated cyclic nucleotide-gated channel 1-like [Priapulus caudatus]|uniref:Potassium/sodium hyperpolarization-activated cyclic nucleotide-gated channel 1-like n=1 Tax=Priapulus caudatus TaxID=37621 RepID=A0ABM1EB21_PRICU|nr:PREDICTED: potassium/sodium hyperpolarization-activated cyclic nucleotide-gated channel 1-like [Priapulus caudatus]